MSKQLLVKITALLILVLVAVSASALATDSATGTMIDSAGKSMMDKELPMPGMMTEAGYIDLKPEEAKMLIDTTPDLVILDVSPKYAEGHLPGALHYYVGDGSLDHALPMLDKSKPYLVYCHIDSASILGATKLVEAGFAPVYRLEGNYPAWVEAGYPVSVLTMEEEIAMKEKALSMPGVEMPALGMMSEAGYIDLSPEEAKALIDTTPDLVIVDVSPKYAEGHLPGALHHYVGDGSLDAAIPMLDKSKPYLVYCHTDSASILGATKLAEAGFAPVYRLEGNYPAWVEAGYPIEK